MLLTVFRAQVSSRDADLAGKISWPAFVAIIIMVTFITAFPFVNDRFTTAFRATNPDLYPGIYQVFRGVAAQPWQLEIKGGELSASADVPATTRMGDWTVVFEPAGMTMEAFMASDAAAQEERVVFFGKKNFAIANLKTGDNLNGGYTSLNGFRSEDLRKGDPDKITRYFIYAVSTGGVAFTFVMTTFLMLFQDVFLVILLGFLLSLSKISVGGASVGSRRGAGFAASVKTTCVVSLGPALLTSVIAMMIPGASMFVWIGFSLLFGMRVVFVYMARFRNKKKAAHRI
jgi:hypothetical protein